MIFQDFTHYPLSLRDNVGFGALARRSDTALLERALTDAAGSDVLERLDHNWDAVLSREHEGGTDLSGGQWQRVALARALAAVGAGARIRTDWGDRRAAREGPGRVDRGAGVGAVG